MPSWSLRLSADPRGLKTNSYAHRGVAIPASSSGPQDAAEGAYHSCLYRQHKVQIHLSLIDACEGFPLYTLFLKLRGAWTLKYFELKLTSLQGYSGA